ncbi:hypothetical protein [Actinomadura fibrosa]|uniref:Uncharacterized protein n=1 Tax=Actinomadura fibrosa TaxID=111802 RepID=A0ABW2XK50_9ACTN|nr:hypothetical protein [Actinomadura fibrosa]
MGVLFDYFRAPDRETAHAPLLTILHGAQEPPLDRFPAKGCDPFIIMGRLLALVLNRSWDVDLVECEIIWPGDSLGASQALPEDDAWETGLVLMELPSFFRDSFADVDDHALPWIADRWSRTREFTKAGFVDSVLDFIEEFIALTRRAQKAGELIYCLSSVRPAG